MTETSGGREQANLPVSAPPANHGNTLAAWVTVVIILIGGLTSTLSIMFSVMPLFWVGLGVVLVGLVVGKVMRMLGMGQPTGASSSTAGA
ncbi:hypothetical protein OEB99_10775 [Actinotalea sp. M2MS4P-6]|uniref:HGxxPAAW family protein n=1 Tax=Actinotalea sp. M2MS4P-6 TaxID=2983762 RepID=UPI0021E49552|nr:HGxxPAAW family protein [Actinotalea sp. M2MS4P-6]MCV2394792.1 hypothetical protein [Actinotalea sp. M2MS4P-6]